MSEILFEIVGQLIVEVVLPEFFGWLLERPFRRSLKEEQKEKEYMLIVIGSLGKPTGNLGVSP